MASPGIGFLYAISTPDPHTVLRNHRSHRASQCVAQLQGARQERDRLGRRCRSARSYHGAELRNNRTNPIDTLLRREQVQIAESRSGVSGGVHRRRECLVFPVLLATNSHLHPTAHRPSCGWCDSLLAVKSMAARGACESRIRALASWVCRIRSSSMARAFREWSVEPRCVLPPSVMDCVPPDRVAHFVREMMAVAVHELPRAVLVPTQQCAGVREPSGLQGSDGTEPAELSHD